MLEQSIGKGAVCMRIVVVKFPKLVCDLLRKIFRMG